MAKSIFYGRVKIFRQGDQARDLVGYFRKRRFVKWYNKKTLSENDKKLIAAAGLDPSTYQSGKYEGKSKISKRGNRHLRRVIWLMTRSVITNNEVFRAYFTKRRKEGLVYKKAVLATAHKLIRVIFAMLSHKTCFVAGGIKYS